MTIMAIYRAADVTREAFAPYDTDILSGPTPVEALLHLVTTDSRGGLCVVDLWSDESALRAWTESRIKPGLAQRGIKYVEPEVFDVGSIATQDAIDRYKILDASLELA